MAHKWHLSSSPSQPVQYSICNTFVTLFNPHNCSVMWDLKIRPDSTQASACSVHTDCCRVTVLRTSWANCPYLNKYSMDQSSFHAGFIRSLPEKKPNIAFFLLVQIINFVCPLKLYIHCKTEEQWNWRPLWVTTDKSERAIISISIGTMDHKTGCICKGLFVLGFLQGPSEAILYSFSSSFLFRKGNVSVPRDKRVTGVTCVCRNASKHAPGVDRF